MQYQWDRKYELIIGDAASGKGLSITDLQITFDINKSANQKDSPDSATIEIYNLSDNSLKYFETQYPIAVLSVGWGGQELKRLFTGEITQVVTRKSEADRITQIQMGSGYVDLNFSRLSQVVPAGKTVKDVIGDIQKQLPGVVRGVFIGTNINSAVIRGYPLTGSARQMLDEVAKKYDLEYRVDNQVLYVNDRLGTTTKNLNLAPVLNKNTGLIEIPYYTFNQTGTEAYSEGLEEGRVVAPTDQPGTTKKSNKRPLVKGLQFKALLNPEIQPGAVVKLESDLFTGYAKVDTARYYGGFRDSDWYVECFCSQNFKRND